MIRTQTTGATAAPEAPDDAPTTARHAPGAGVAPAPPRESARIMIVDDEPTTVKVVRRLLADDGYAEFVTTSDPVDALTLAARERPDLVLLDVNMPRVSGLEVLDAIRRDPEAAATPVVILTADDDRDTRLKALRRGATDFLQKPVDPTELTVRVRNLLLLKAHQDRLRDQTRTLEEAVRARTAELEDSRRDVIRCLARAAEFRDDDTGHHILRVGRYARLIGARLGLSPAHLDLLEPAAQLHDVGKIGIQDAILLKPGRLTADEFDRMRRHCNFGKRILEGLAGDGPGADRGHAEIGARILDSGRSEVLKLAMRIALTHHERWDGTGYPLGLAGDDIPLEGRITAAADVFDALSTRRPYKPALPLDQCFAILEEGRGSHFDPRVLDAFFAARPEIVAAQIAYADVD